ncbi:SWIM zinc finger family protein [Lysinibacillus sp. NPDC096212]|uniref:SWIM zinc finger family protein n=1 Tax=unclassified Lysinibacillus TaxID=2636778 RepID=UPI003830B96A
MNINTFEKQFKKVIIQRGHDYYVKNHVIDIMQIDNSNWQAEVEGTEPYTVDVVITSNGDITYANCDCPYDDDCKHIAAVLYAIKEQLNNPPVPVSRSSKVKKSTLQQLLTTQTKENLISLILTVGENSPNFLQELEMRLMEPTDIVKAAKKMIVQHLKSGQEGRSGFIPRHRASKALKGVYSTLQHAKEHIDEENYITAIELSFLCLQYTLEALQYGDDSDGHFGDAINESLELISQAIEEGASLWSKEQYETVYELVIQKAMQHELDGWVDCRIHLLHACVPLCVDDAIEEQFKTLIHSMESTSDDWNAQYINKELNQVELHLLQNKYSSKEVEAFLEKHIEDYHMREQIIQSAINRGEYEKILQLTADGIQQDQQLPGIVSMWQRYAFLAHQHLGHTEEMRELALTLLQQGDYDFYKEFKALHSTEQWPEVLEELLNSLTNSQLYARLIVEEQQSKRILDYCKEYPTRIEDYYQFIKEQYYEEVCALFIDAVTIDAQSSANRKNYKDVCRSINIMRKAGYTVEAERLITDLLQTYPKRPAFIEELKSIMK